jgi:hypothetical protein
MIPAFVLHTYKDQERAKKRITSLRTLYPSSPVIAIADGVDDADYAAFCKDNKVQYTLGDRLKLPEFSGKWTERWMRAYLDQTDAPLVIKLDPDTGVFKALASFPGADVFGKYSYLTNSDLEMLGGCVGFTRRAVEKILDTKMLGQYRFSLAGYTYPRFAPNRLLPGEGPEERQFISVQDRIVSYIVKHLKLSLADWPQVAVECGGRPSLAPADFAFVHPYLD